jgi:hypothetical protein
MSEVEKMFLNDVTVKAAHMQLTGSLAFNLLRQADVHECRK